MTTTIPSTTLHWTNADVEVHRVVVGSYDNNVFIVRCRRTGEAVLKCCRGGVPAFLESAAFSTCPRR